MKILINTTNLYVGGGVQVALSFINELAEMKTKHEYHIMVSSALHNQLNYSDFPANAFFYIINKSPSFIKTRKKVQLQLNGIEINVKPDIVFSIFGPSYWRPKAVHLIGFADGWVYNPHSIAYKKLKTFSRLKRRLHNVYKKYYLKKDAEYYILETNDAKLKFAKILNVDCKNVFVVGNTYSSVFNNIDLLDENNEYYIKLPENKENKFRLVYIAHNHANKNLAIIRKVLPSLGNEVEIILTITKKNYVELFGDKEKSIINIGPIVQNSCPSIYKQVDALFAPTLLETFSASYPEAMKMRKPILTSEYSFATDLCGDTAVYFDPLNPDDIASKIKLLINDQKLVNDLIAKGAKKLLNFESSRTRAEKYIALCEKIVNNY